MGRGSRCLVGRSTHGGRWSRRRLGRCSGLVRRGTYGGRWSRRRLGRCSAWLPASGAAVAAACGRSLLTTCSLVASSGETRVASGAEPRRPRAVRRAWRVRREDCHNAVGDDTSPGAVFRGGCSPCCAPACAVEDAAWNSHFGQRAIVLRSFSPSAHAPGPGSRRSSRWQVQMPGGMWPDVMQAIEEPALPDSTRPGWFRAGGRSGGAVLSHAGLVIGRGFLLPVRMRVMWCARAPAVSRFWPVLQCLRA